VELIRLQGGIVTSDDRQADANGWQVKTKAASLHWEFMFARAMRQTLDKGGANQRQHSCGHAPIETGAAKGKIVVEGF
jgi:hypothetical protein